VPKPQRTLAVAGPLPPLVSAAEAASTVVPQAVVSAPVSERAAATAVPKPLRSLAVAGPLPPLVPAAEAASTAVPQLVASSPMPEQDVRPPDTLSERPDVGEVVLDYCTAVRGILNDDQGGPLHPCGVRMAAALGEVRQSLERSLAAQKGGAHKSNSGG
jgi:hypothetical protein